MIFLTNFVVSVKEALKIHLKIDLNFYLRLKIHTRVCLYYLPTTEKVVRKFPNQMFAYKKFSNHFFFQEKNGHIRSTELNRVQINRSTEEVKKQTKKQTIIENTDYSN